MLEKASPTKKQISDVKKHGKVHKNRSFGLQELASKISKTLKLKWTIGHKTAWHMLPEIEKQCIQCTQHQQGSGHERRKPKSKK